VDNSVRLSSAWGMSVKSRWFPRQAEFEDYNKVRCPKCSHVDPEPRIAVLGLFPMKFFLLVVLVVVAAIFYFG
jgi:hypothetical protein